MTLTELDAIRARDAAPLSQQVVLDALYDRRRLLAYVDELRAELAALKDAAGKVGCIACDNAGEII